MTPNTVQPITDEQLAEMEWQCQEMRKGGGAILMSEECLSSIIGRLRAAEKDQARYLWLKENAVDAGMWTDESIDAAMHQG